MTHLPKPARVRHRDVPPERMRSGQIKYEHGFHRENLERAKAKAHAEEVVNEVLERVERKTLAST